MHTCIVLTVQWSKNNERLTITTTNMLTTQNSVVSTEQLQHTRVLAGGGGISSTYDRRAKSACAFSSNCFCWLHCSSKPALTWIALSSVFERAQYVGLKLSGQRNRTAAKQFQNNLKTVLKLFRLSFISLCGQFNLRFLNFIKKIRV